MPQPTDEQTAEIGRRIREERKRQGLTLDKLGERVGRSAAYLSQIENGRVNVNITNLEAIGRALGVPLIKFFVDGDAPAVSVVRRSERRWFDLGRGQATEALLVKALGNLEIFVMRLPPDSDSVRDSSHPGEEFCYVIRGTARMVLNNERVYDLEEGDVIYYRSDIPHLWQNVGSEEAEVLVVNTPATY